MNQNDTNLQICKYYDNLYLEVNHGEGLRDRCIDHHASRFLFHIHMDSYGDLSDIKRALANWKIND